MSGFVGRRPGEFVRALDVLWAREDRPGLEHLRLEETRKGVVADGLVITTGEAGAYRARYSIVCDAKWRARAVYVDVGVRAFTRVELRADGEGRWTDAAGAPLAPFDGCIDLDISGTPFTNTLPIRRLHLGEGASRELRVLYVALPELQLSVSPQRYTRLAGRRYRYESLDSGFTANVAVDEDGLVTEYPGFCRMVARA